MNRLCQGKITAPASESLLAMTLIWIKLDPDEMEREHQTVARIGFCHAAANSLAANSAAGSFVHGLRGRTG